MLAHAHCGTVHGRQTSVTLKPAWSIKRVPGKGYIKTLSQTKQDKITQQQKDDSPQQKNDQQTRIGVSSKKIYRWPINT